jgi:hypothetical protein
MHSYIPLVLSSVSSIMHTQYLIVKLFPKELCTCLPLALLYKYYNHQKGYSLIHRIQSKDFGNVIHSILEETKNYNFLQK